LTSWNLPKDSKTSGFRPETDDIGVTTGRDVNSLLKALAASISLAALMSCSQDTDKSGNYYHNKDVSYIVATNAGGGYDAYARLIGNYLTKYLGADHVIIRNVPGAGHIVGANTLWRSKPDGLTIGTFNAGLIYGQLVGKAGMNFDLREFAWIGKAAGEPRSIVVSNNCAIKNMADLMAATEPVKFGSAGIGSASYSDMMLLARALNLHVEVIAGFDGTEGEMSMMRGEICAILGSTSSFQNFVNAGHGNYILTIGGTLDGVPHARDLVTSDEGMRLITIIDALATLGRISAAPPGTPDDLVKSMRSAYRAALEDKDLLAEAAKMGLPIEPAYGDDVKQLVVDALDQTPETIELIRKAINGTQ
jgi:tripartite-type tricarboxylate transporter receptor subunit TctC